MLTALRLPERHTYVTRRGHIIDATRVEFVAGVFHQLRVEELVENAAQRAAVPVVGHPASVVALARHVAQGVVGQLLGPERALSAAGRSRARPAGPGLLARLN